MRDCSYLRGWVFGVGRLPLSSCTKKEPKPKLLSPDIFWWGRGLPREGVGAKKFGMSFETREIKLLWRDIPGFCRDIPKEPEKFENKIKFVFNSRPLFLTFRVIFLFCKVNILETLRKDPLTQA